MTGYQYKALSTSTNTRAELQDIYDAAIFDTVNNTPTLFRLFKQVQNKGDYASWTSRTGRNSSAGSNSELGDVTSGQSTDVKFTTAIKINTAFPEVTDFMVASHQTAGIGPEDIYTYEVQKATEDLLGRPYTDASTKMGINAQCFYDGTGNGSKDIIGLKAVVDDSSSTISSVTSLYGKTRASYSALYSAAVNTTTEPISIGRMRSNLATLQSAGADMSKMVIVTTHALKNRILDLHQSGQRYTTEAKFGFGVLSLPTFDDIPIYADKDCESGKVYFLDMSTWEMRVLKNFYYEDMSKTAMSRKGKIAFYGELVCKNVAWNGVLTNKS